MELKVAVAKVPKFGLTESGDSVELVERPRGGVTAIMADGQMHGRAAKRISQLVVAKAAQLIADGVRDGAVARGTHDFLHAVRDGKVSTELVMISADLRTRSLVVTRNTHVPVLLRHPNGEVEHLETPVEPIGTHAVMKPIIAEYPLEPGTVVLAFTDGIFSAGRRYDRELRLGGLIDRMTTVTPEEVQQLADGLLNVAIELDQGRPADDMSVLAVGVAAGQPGLQIRRINGSIPF